MKINNNMMFKDVKFNVYLIFNFLKENKLSKKAFARNCGVSIFFLNKLLSGNIHLRMSKILKIVDYMNIKVSELLGV